MKGVQITQFHFNSFFSCVSPSLSGKHVTKWQWVSHQFSNKIMPFLSENGFSYFIYWFKWNCSIHTVPIHSILLLFWSIWHKNTIFVLKPLVEKRYTLTLIQKNSLLHVHQNLDIQQKKCKTPNIRGRGIWVYLSSKSVSKLHWTPIEDSTLSEEICWAHPFDESLVYNSPPGSKAITHFLMCCVTPQASRS